MRCHLHTVEEHTNGWPAAVVLARTTLLLPTAKFYTAAAAVWTRRTHRCCPCWLLSAVWHKGRIVERLDGDLALGCFLSRLIVCLVHHHLCTGHRCGCCCVPARNAREALLATALWSSSVRRTLAASSPLPSCCKACTFCRTCVTARCRATGNGYKPQTVQAIQTDAMNE